MLNLRFIMRTKAIILFLLMVQLLQAAPRNVLEGTVRDAETREAISGVVIKIDDGAIWAVTGIDGKYTISLPNGKYLLTTDCLGYVSLRREVLVSDEGTQLFTPEGRQQGTELFLSAESLALDEVYVTAQHSSSTLGTAHNIGKDALNHLQMASMSDMAALLPGGKTSNPDLTQNNPLILRDAGTTEGNAAFGTALMVDGVRIGNNAAMGDMTGASSRSIAVENIESIEVITGVASAEYGDFNSGMVKVNTKKGRSPLNLSFSVNPRTYQVALSKGVDFKNKGGVLNVNAEWARATSKITSPYTSYTRRTVGATYSNTFFNALRFELGGSANIGGMNSKDDPDASNGNTSSARDNVFRANTSLNWMVNAGWITNLKFEASVFYNDNMQRAHTYSDGISKPAVHSQQQGYYFAQILPMSYYADMVVDSKELDFAASLKYEWNRDFAGIKNKLKAGVQLRSEGNIGEGEYYADMKLAPNGYRPRPYSQYPFMHNLSEYIEDQISIPVGNSKLDIMAGLRLEQVFVKGTSYKSLNSLSPRFNAKWEIAKHFSIHGGWGISEKLPSFGVLFPKQEYRDIQTFSASKGDDAYYVYYTQPFQMVYNPQLQWQRNSNSEFGFDYNHGEWGVSLVGFYNITKNPYHLTSIYNPLSVNMLKNQSSANLPDSPEFKVDSQTGEVFVRGSKEEYWTPLEFRNTDRTFVKANMQTNGKPVTRAGVELTVDFPKIKPIRTSFRLDAAYSYSSYVDDLLSAYYNDGWKHSSLADRSYEYVGIYARGTGNSTFNGKVSHSLNANLTSITHITEARLIFTFRLEASILRRSRNISVYEGAEYAYNVSEAGNTPTGGSIYKGNSYTAIRPVYYMDLDGATHPFTDIQAADPAFEKLIIKSGNAYGFNQDGYGFYCSANFSITKEIGKHVSLSFYANNFTATRPAVKSMATGVSAVFTPNFYYGLSCRIKI